MDESIFDQESRRRHWEQRESVPPSLPVPVIEGSAYDALLAERDALKAALNAECAHYQECSSELAALKIENDEADALNTRLGDILTLVANALKGEPDSRCLHSWADLAQVAAALKEKAERLHHIATSYLVELYIASDQFHCLSCRVTWMNGGEKPLHAPDCPAHPDFLTTSATESREAKGGTT